MAIAERVSSSARGSRWYVCREPPPHRQVFLLLGAGDHADYWFTSAERFLMISLAVRASRYPSIVRRERECAIRT